MGGGAGPLLPENIGTTSIATTPKTPTLTEAFRRPIATPSIPDIIRKLPGLISPLRPRDPAANQESEHIPPPSAKPRIRHPEPSPKSKKTAGLPSVQSEERATPGPCGGGTLLRSSIAQVHPVTHFCTGVCNRKYQRSGSMPENGRQSARIPRRLHPPRIHAPRETRCRHSQACSEFLQGLATVATICTRLRHRVANKTARITPYSRNVLCTGEEGSHLRQTRSTEQSTGHRCPTLPLSAPRIRRKHGPGGRAKSRSCPLPGKSSRNAAGRFCETMSHVCRKPSQLRNYARPSREKERRRRAPHSSAWEDAG